MARGRRKGSDFLEATKRVLARRVGEICSFPGCSAATSGPHTDPSKSANVGKAAHITAAAPDGPRYDPSLTMEQRRSPENGIWMCGAHHDLIDNDRSKYSAEEIRSWKQDAEEAQLQRLQKGSSVADLNSIWLAEVEHSAGMLEDYLPKSCLNWLARLKPRFWNVASLELRRKTLRLEARCHFQLQQRDVAGHLFCESGKLLIQDVDAQCDVALGYYLQGEHDQAKTVARAVIESAPFHVRAWSVLIAVLSQELGYADILAAIPETCLSDRQVQFALGAAALHLSSPSEAVKWLTQSRDQDWQNDIEITERLAHAIISELDDVAKIFPGKLLTDHERNQVTRACGLLEHAWEEIDGTEVVLVHLTVPSNLANLKFMLGDYREGLHFVEDGLRFDSNNEILQKQKAFILLESGRISEARFFLEDSILKKPANSLIILLGACLLNQGQAHEVLQLLASSQLQLPTEDEEDRAIALRLMALLNSDQVEEAKRVYSNLTVTQQERPLLRVNHARILLAANDIRAASQALKQIFEKELSTLEPLQCLEVADTCFQARLWNEAKEIYSKYIDTSRDSPGLRRLLESYVALDERQRAYQIAKGLREKHGPLKLVTSFEVSMLESVGDLPSAAEVLRQLSEKFPEDEDAKLSLADVNLRLGRNEEADLYLTSNINWKALPADMICYLAQLMLRRGFGLHALEMLYQARRIPSLSSSSGRLHLSYMMTFLSTEDRTGFEHERIEEGTSFLFEQDGQAHWRTILRTCDLPPLTPSELAPGSDFANRAMGLKITEQLATRKSQYDETNVSIKEIQSNYVRAFQEVLATFEERFGDDAGLWQIRLPKVLDDGGEEKYDFAVIKKSTAQRAHFVREVEGLYQNGFLTMSVVASLLGGDQIAVWTHLTSREEIGVRVSSGDQRDLERVKIELETTRPKLVPDLSALLTLKALDLRGVVEQVFGPLVLTQGVLDEVAQAIAHRELLHSKPHLSVASHDGKLVGTEITQEDIDQNLATMRGFESWLKNSFSVHSVEEVLTLSSSRVRTIRDSIGSAGAYAMIKGAASGNILYSDDLALRDLHRNEFGCDSVSTEMVLSSLRAAGAIDAQTYTSKLTELVGLNYRALGITSAVVAEAASKSKFEVQGYFHSVCAALRYAGYTATSQIALVAQSLIALNDLPLSQAVKLNLSFSLLDSVANDWNRSFIARAVFRAIQRSTVLIVPSHQQVEQTIQAWVGRRSAVKLL